MRMKENLGYHQRGFPRDADKYEEGEEEGDSEVWLQRSTASLSMNQGCACSLLRCLLGNSRMAFHGTVFRSYASHELKRRPTCWHDH